MKSKTYPFVEQIVAVVEPLEEEFYGSVYRCSLTLRDGTHLPCATLQSRRRYVDLAKRRIKEEMSGQGVFSPQMDGYHEIVENFAAGGSQVDDYNVALAGTSRYAVPRHLMEQIHGETTMAWTGWVFRMRDGRCFSYGSPFRWDFLDLPDGYEFSDIVEVINHSYVDGEGQVRPLVRGGLLPEGYACGEVLRERIYFTCYVDGIDVPQSENSPNRSSSSKIVGASALAKAKRRWFSWPSPK